MKQNVRESSLEAYETLKTQPMAHQEWQVLSGVAYLVLEGLDTDGWVSRRQIAHTTKLETSTVAARVNSLLAAGRLIESMALMRCPISGRNVHMVRLLSGEFREAA